MGWKIVEIENADRLRLFLDNLVIYKEEDKININLSPNTLEQQKIVGALLDSYDENGKLSKKESIYLIYL